MVPCLSMPEHMDQKHRCNCCESEVVHGFTLFFSRREARYLCICSACKQDEDLFEMIVIFHGSADVHV